MKKIILAAIPFLVVVGGIIIIAAIATNGKDAAKYSLSLNRVQLCILSVPTDERTQSDIEHCYQKIENETHVVLVRDIKQ